MSDRIPKKITPCPIHEAVVGLTFETEIVSEAVFGIIYNEFKDQYKEIKKLPILNIPEEIRMKDAALINQAWYHLKERNYIIAIGPRTLGISNNEEYSGWTVFSKTIGEAIEKIKKTNIIKKVSRVGIRYINFFEFNIFERIELAAKIKNEPFVNEQMLINTKVRKESFINTLQIVNNTNIKTGDKSFAGSVIDIDTYTDDNLDNFLNNYKEILEEGHRIEKELFFSLLKEGFLKSLNPEY